MKMKLGAIVIMTLGMASMVWAEPVEIRLGHGFAAEETLWLMAAKPDVTPNQGKVYRLKMTPFRANDERLKAFLAGELDGGTVTGFSALHARAQGVPVTLVASISRESSQGFSTTFLTLDESPIRSARDLKGKTVGIVDFKSSTDLWGREAVRKAGLDPNTDVKFVVIPFPAQGTALRTKKIDAGVFPQPFYAIEMEKGGLRPLFSGREVVPFDIELIDLFLRREFLDKHPDVARAFLADLVKATDYYTRNPGEARKALIDAKFVRVPAPTYLGMKDYYRAPDCRVDAKTLAELQETLAQAGWLEVKSKVRMEDLVDNSYLPR